MTEVAARPTRTERNMLPKRLGVRGVVGAEGSPWDSSRCYLDSLDYLPVLRLQY